MVAELAKEISSASKEQAQGVLEINKAVSQLDTTTQQNNAISEETANSSKELLEQATSLNACVDDLVLTVSGRRQNNESKLNHTLIELQVDHDSIDVRKDAA